MKLVLEGRLFFSTTVTGGIMECSENSSHSPSFVLSESVVTFSASEDSFSRPTLFPYANAIYWF